VEGCDENKEWRGAGSMREGEEGCGEYEKQRGWRGVGSMREGEEWGVWRMREGRSGGVWGE